MANFIDRSMTKIDIREFDRLVASETQGPLTYARVIERLVVMAQAKAGACWNCEQQPPALLAHYSAGQAAKLGFSQSDHVRILTQVAGQQRSAIVKTKALDATEAITLFFAPLPGDSKRVVELVFPSDHAIGSSAGNSAGFVQELKHLCEVIARLPLANSDASALVTQPSVTQPSPIQSSSLPFSLESFSRFNRVIHSSILRGLTCANVANEARLLLDCDRVSVMLWHRGRFRLQAISGQPTINRRSTVVKQLERLGAEVLRARTELWYPNDQQLAPQIKSLLDSYLLTATTRSLVIAPVLSSDAQTDPSVTTTAHADEVIGGILFEHNRQHWLKTDKAAALNLIKEHGGDALRNAVQHQNLFLYWLWHFLGKSKVLSAPALLSRASLALVAVLLFGLLLAFYPTAFYISASGILVPEQRRLVFPKLTGEVVKVHVEHGAAVNQDQLLVELRSQDLQLRMEDVQGRLETLKQRRSALERNKFKSSGPTTGANLPVDDNLNSLQTEIDSLQRQSDELNQMQAGLQVVSPIAGQVITWDVARKLSGRTVAPQNVLLEIANTAGPWELELELEDRYIEDLQRGLSKQHDQPLTVRFTLAADPSRTYEGRLSHVARAIQLSQDNQPMMRLRVNIDEDAVQLRQARTGVTAKIYTGEQCSLGSLWLHEIPRALNRYIFFYFVR